jgi:hypothetical protein
MRAHLHIQQVLIFGFLPDIRNLFLDLVNFRLVFSSIMVGDLRF